MSLYQKAVEKWGVEAQLNMLVEECAELIDALSKMKRGRVTATEVIGECIDVQIMLRQAEHMVGCPFIWKTVRKEKMERFKAHLEGYMHAARRKKRANNHKV